MIVSIIRIIPIYTPPVIRAMIMPRSWQNLALSRKVLLICIDIRSIWKTESTGFMDMRDEGEKAVKDHSLIFFIFATINIHSKGHFFFFLLLLYLKYMR